MARPGSGPPTPHHRRGGGSRLELVPLPSSSDRVRLADSVEGPIGEGWPDLVLVRPRDRRLLFIEVKSTKGTVSDAQNAVHEVLRSAGLSIRVVRPNDVDDILEVLR